MKKNSFINIFILFLGFLNYSQERNDSIENVVSLIDNVINWQNQQTDHINKYTLTNWQFATYYIGLMKVFKTIGNDDYIDYLFKVGEAHKWETQPDMYHADKIAISQVYIDLYKESGKEELIKNTKWVLNANLTRDKPLPDVRYEGNPYRQEWWSWCDALFMAPPTFVKMYQITKNEKYLDYAIDNWLLSLILQEIQTDI